MKNNLQLALDWAAKGFYVFPCVPNEKIPMTENGLWDATRDVEQIKEWWTECPEANIGASPDASGHFVIDIDDKGEKNGSNTLQELELFHGSLPDTFTIGTPTGGRHLWFMGNERTSVQKLGEGLDTRGHGGYVILPGSKLESGQYRTLRDGAISKAPDWIGKAMAARCRDKENAIAEELDTPANVKRAISYLERLARDGDVAIEGAGGNETTYRVAAMLHDLGVSQETAVELILEHWNEHCEPPWSEGELIDETHSPIFHAYQYSQNEAGSKGLRDNATNFAGITRDGKPIADGTERVHDSSRFRLRDERAQDTRPDPEWSVPGWIQDQSTVMLFGPPGSYKSFVALDVALSFSAGKRAFGIEYSPPTGQSVVYCAGEGAIGIEKLRRPAWKQHRRVTEDIPFYTVSDVPTASEDPTEVQDLIDQIDAAGVKPSLIVFDTLSRMLTGLDENSAKDASVAVKRIEEIKRNYNCIVMVVHHSNKDGRSERGSSAFRGGFDTLISCEKEGETVTLHVEKQKDAEAPKPLTLQAVKVGKSLTFSPATAKEEIHKEEPEKADKNRRERNIIKEILERMGATNLGNGLTTKTLATEYVRETEGHYEDVGEEQQAVRRKESALSRKAKGALSGYVVSDHGDPPIWALAQE